MTFYVKCNLCDSRGQGITREHAAKAIRHSPGCPVNENAQRCVKCDRRGEHHPRCPFVTGEKTGGR